MAGILVVLTSLSVVLAGLTIWLHETLMDTDSFVATVTPVFAEEEVTEALSEYLTEQAFVALGIEERVDSTLSRADNWIEQQVLGLVELSPGIEQRLAGIDRPRFADLTDPIVAAARTSVEDAAEQYLSSDEFQQALGSVTRRAHSAAVALLREDYEALPRVVVDERTVRLDLTPIVAGVIQRAVAGGIGFIGFDPPASFQTPVDTPDQARNWMAETLRFEPPPTFAQVTVMSADRLEDFQGWVTTFDRAVWLLVVLVVVLGAGAVWASSRRLRTLMQLSVGAVLAVLAAGLVIDRLEQVVVDSFGDPAGREAARAVLVRTLSGLWTLGVVVLALAILVGVVAFAVSRNWHREAAAWLVSDAGRSDLRAFVSRRYDALRVVGALTALVVLWITGIGLWPVLVVGVILSAFLLTLSALRESADDSQENVSAQPKEQA